MSRIGLVSALLVLAAPSLHVSAQPQSDFHMWHGPWGGWFFGPVMMIVFLAAVVAVIVLLVRWLSGSTHQSIPPPSPGKTPLDILKERFARGEIDKEEFEERRRILDE